MAEAAVVGAGLLGLAVAQRLRERGDDVTVFERAPMLGGAARAWDPGEPAWDGHDHVLLRSDLRMLRLLEKLGLERDVRWIEARSCVIAGPTQRRQPLSSPADLLRLPELGLLDKGRIAATILFAARSVDDESASTLGACDWLSRWSGARAVSRFWYPVLRAQAGDLWSDVPAGFARAAIRRRLAAARRSGPSVQMVGLLRGGYPAVLDRYADRLADEGVKINLGARVCRIEAGPQALEVHLDDSLAGFDRVVVTTAAPIAARLCPALTSVERERLATAPYAALICVALGVRAPLSPYFTTYLADPSFPFDAVIEPAHVSGASGSGGSPVFLPRLVPQGHPLLSAPDTVVIDDFLAHLERLAPGLGSLEPQELRIVRSRFALALPVPGRCSPWPSTNSVPGLQLLGSANRPLGAPWGGEALALLQELRR